MRINEVSRQLGVENKDVIEYLETIGVHNKSHSSSVDNQTLDLVLSHFKSDHKEDEEEKKKSAKRFAKVRRPKNYKPQDEEEQTDEASVSTQQEDVSAEANVTVAKTKEATPKEEEKEIGLFEITPPPEAKSSEKTVQSAETKSKGKKGKPQQKKTSKKPTKTLTLGAETTVKKEIIIDASDISITDEDIQEPKAPIVTLERDRDEDPIRKEIQKLKQKQKRSQAKKVEDGSPQKPPSGPRRRPMGQPKGKTKKAWKREKRERLEKQMAEEEQRIERELTVLKVHEATTVADIANGLEIPVNELITKLITMGVMASINQPLDIETIQIIADDFEFEVEQIDLYDSDLFTQLWSEDTDESRMTSRAPVVTIMGHVDHGKTKLLDAIRSTDVVSQEAGGITQHIGAYHVNTPKGELVFLDTPGHEAFTAMRARGAMVTDIVILVVAATDGIMPQTVEAIHHAKAADVPIIVAINKVDLEGANIDRVKQQLSENGLSPDDWGGSTSCVEVSALKKMGIDDLLETVLLQAELLELKADPECRARGTIIEGQMEQGRGAVVTVLIQQGTLRIGDPFVTGIYSGRVRAMSNDKGEKLEVAGPSQPVEILGIEDVPSAGDPFIVVTDDSQAKQLSARLQQIQRERDMRRLQHVTLEDLHSQIEAGSVKTLFIIVKGDVQGSVGAVCESLRKIESDKVKIDILHSGVGAVTESDVMLASASNAIIIGFNVRPRPQVEELAKSEHVEIRSYRIIYDAIEDIRKAMTGMLDKVFEERFIGRAEIREVYRLSKGISIAGSYILDGKLVRNAPVRLLRDSVIIHEGKLSSLRRFKDDVKEVQSGYECGLGFESFSDLRDGDVVECYEMVEIAATL